MAHRYKFDLGYDDSSYASVHVTVELGAELRPDVSQLNGVVDVLPTGRYTIGVFVGKAFTKMEVLLSVMAIVAQWARDKKGVDVDTWEQLPTVGERPRPAIPAGMLPKEC